MPCVDFDQTVQMERLILAGHICNFVGLGSVIIVIIIKIISFLYFIVIFYIIILKVFPHIVSAYVAAGAT